MNHPFKKSSFLKSVIFLWVGAFFLLGVSHLFAQEDEQNTKVRSLLSDLVLSENDQKEEIIEALSKESDPLILSVIEAWRVGKISTVQEAEEEKPAVLMQINDQEYVRLIDGSKFAPHGEIKKNRASGRLRRKLRPLVTFIKLNSSDPKERISSAEQLGMKQQQKHLPLLEARYEKEKDPKVKKVLIASISISQLANGSEEEKLKAVQTLGEQKSFASRQYLEQVKKDYQKKEESNEIISAVDKALVKIDQHQKLIGWMGMLIRGLSLGSVLLLVSYGLAITFGQMGVINMAHGEFIAIGAYTTYWIQNFFAKNYGESSSAFGWYFVVAIIGSFLVAAIAGAILEKGLIQFLYKRPLESLLATWGVSMVIQQVIRLKFGAANVSVSSPEWLSGSYHLGGLSMSYNRLLLIACALLLILVTWLLMHKTSWGLHVRATMQNRQMASNLGVPSGRVNMLTFAFGSGLAGLAGAFISQIGNVGPTMGQTYIVDSFMVVVVGGVGNLLGAALSSFGIGIIDQSLQPILGPVMGKITVLFLIILFLQFKPGGLFPSRSRSLDD